MYEDSEPMASGQSLRFRRKQTRMPLSALRTKCVGDLSGKKVGGFFNEGVARFDCGRTGDVEHPILRRIGCFWFDESVTL